MKPNTVETLIWVLIYGGLLSLCLGFFVTRDDAALGGGLMLAGGVVAGIGVVLIFVRARMTSEGPR